MDEATLEEALGRTADDRAPTMADGLPNGIPLDRFDPSRAAGDAVRAALGVKPNLR